MSTGDNFRGNDAERLEKPGVSAESVRAGYEVTPDMIEAGLDAFAGFNEDFVSREEMLAEVYRAMALASGSQHRGPKASRSAR